VIVKIVGKVNGTYTERVEDDVKRYLFENRCDELETLVFTGPRDVPYSRVTLIFKDKDEDKGDPPISISFNDKVFCMEGSNGRTIDILKYDARKDY